MIRHVNLRHWKLLTRNHIFLYIVAKRAQTIWREYNCIFECWVIAEVSSLLTRFLAISRPRAVLGRLLNGLHRLSRGTKVCISFGNKAVLISIKSNLLFFHVRNIYTIFLEKRILQYITPIF